MVYSLVVEFLNITQIEIKLEMKPRLRTVVAALGAAYDNQHTSPAANELVKCVLECGVGETEVSSCNNLDS